MDVILGLIPRLQRLWAQGDFARMWSAHTVSQFGSQVTLLALPLTAAATLQASPTQMGLLAAMSTLPALLLGLPAGAWIDRWPRRRVLIVTDLVRFALLLIVPAAALIGLLRIEVLFAVAFLAGVATLFFDLAAQSYLPVIIGRAQLIDGNAKLEASRSAATVAGPSIAGLLFQVLSAPLSLAVDAVTYLLSAWLLAGIRQPEPPARTTDAGLWRSIQEGVRLLWQNDILRTIFRTVIVWNLFVNVLQANFILFATREFQATPLQLGLLFSMLGVGMLVGAGLVGVLRRRIGIGPLFIASGFVAASSGVLTALAGVLGREYGFPVLLLAQFIFGFGPMIFSINDVTLRQSVTPNHLQGRVTATYRFGIFSTAPLGAIIGGLLGDSLGLLPAIAIGACGMVTAVSLLLLSPLPGVVEPPLPSEVAPGD